MTALEVLGLYLGLPALLFGTITLLVLVLARRAEPTGSSPVLRPGPAPSVETSSAPDGPAGTAPDPDDRTSA